MTVATLPLRLETGEQDQERRKGGKYVVTVRFPPELQDRLADAIFKANLLAREHRRAQVEEARRRGDRKTLEDMDKIPAVDISINTFCMKAIMKEIIDTESRAGRLTPPFRGA